MIYLRIFAVFISLLGLSDQSHAYGGPPSSSVSSGEIMILPPPDEQQQEQWLGASGKPFKSGKWLALACDEDKCRLESVMLKVIHNPLPDVRSLDEYHKELTMNSYISQTMKWDLSAIRDDENVVMFVNPHADLKPGAVRTFIDAFLKNAHPHADLKPGAVQTWYAPSPADDRPNGYYPNGNATAAPVDSTISGDDRVNTGEGTSRAKTKPEIVVATDSADKADRKSIVVPLAITNKGCTKTQADNRECLRTSFRVQLREGKVHQWLGAPTTDPCFPIGFDAILPNDYLIWVGDLDHDQKPDYIINLGPADGYTLFLSSLAKPGQLVGEAGHYQAGIQCD
jgi:hypothetical protein